MTIANGYATLAEFKAHRPGIGSVDAADDSVIENIIEAASRWIDHETGRTFYARSETHYYDVPHGRELLLDDDLLTVTTLTNGDGTTLTTANYNLVPKNKSPYYGIKLKETSTYLWQMDTDGNTEDVITLVGTWGFAATAPDDIKQAVLELSNNMYSRRTGQQTDGVATVTAAGVVLQPRDVPGWVRSIIGYYRRRI